ncbi:MAG: hypothetical protein CR984_05455 [Proteobacteria bacterium]|nr:MAG: hypothetical protein CR984_05455 [Pseudomonadota bacterium]
MIEGPNAWPDVVNELGLRMPLAVDSLSAGSLEIAGLKGARLNWLGRSVIIEYDPACWPQKWWDELFDTQDPQRLRELLEKALERLNPDGLHH